MLCGDSYKHIFATGEIYDEISKKWVAPANVELGHRKDDEFWYLRNVAEAKGLTQAEFNDYMNNPDFYAWQDVITNRNHSIESKH